MPLWLTFAGLNAVVEWQFSQVSSVFGCVRWLAFGQGAVVTGEARAVDLRVIHTRNGLPHDDGVAGRTLIAGLKVGQGLAGCDHAIVATHTIADVADVLDVRRLPLKRRVTVVAAIGGGNMVAGFTSGLFAVVTGCAGAIDLCVIDTDHRLPSEYGVAGLALHGRADMIERLAGGVNAVVAGGAASLQPPGDRSDWQASMSPSCGRHRSGRSSTRGFAA